MLKTQRPFKVKSGKRTRWSYASWEESVEIQDLNRIQKQSYEKFINEGIDYVLKKISPIEPNKIGKDKKTVYVEFVGHRFGEPQYTQEEARLKGLTWAKPMFVKTRFVDSETREIREEDLFFGTLPIMNDRGIFVVNGAERVVVNQLIRSPGVYFLFDEDKPQFVLAHVLPERGSWLEIYLNRKKDPREIQDMIDFYVSIDRKKRVGFLSFIKAIGYDTKEKLFEAFEDEIDLVDSQSLAYHIDNLSFATKPIINKETGEIILDAGERADESLYSIIYDKGVTIVDGKKQEKIYMVDPVISSIIANASEEELDKTQSDAILDIYSKLKPEDLRKNPELYFQDIYFNDQTYSLGEIGRVKFNERLSIEGVDYKALRVEDIILIVKKLFSSVNDEDSLDIKDHLGNKRIRSVGEFFTIEFERALNKSKALIQDKLSTVKSISDISASTLNLKPILQSIVHFLMNSQLSQFLDQTNPLSELTNRRRMSALGPGGLKREHAKFEVRDVHHTHYGRICPIETPDGQNIGLITSLAIFSEPDDYGFLRTPYKKVVDGYLTDEVVYLNANEEAKYKIADSGTKLIEKNGKLYIKDDEVPVRFKEHITMALREEINYIDASTRQLVSVSTSLIPFLEHDDAGRALMGSNMQRQAVPLLKPEAPIVSTGMELYAARDSGYVVFPEKDGVVKYVSSDKIVIENDDKTESVYHLIKFRRTNQSTVINQHPIVDKGDKVTKNTPIADGFATDMGELALGKNLLVAFLPWEGYNFEDAIVISERLLEEDTLTSIHIEEYEVAVRDTKLGPEIVTADIPNVSKKKLRNLDENGIIRLGAFVHKGDVLVGKLTPKSESPLTPEEKLVRSIFGEKSKQKIDSSLKMPHGAHGRVIDVRIYDKSELGDSQPGVKKLIKIKVATRKPISIGDKLSGRHGNKGVISNILAKEDMPFMPDGTPVDVLLTPLGVPSRMNLGQLLETHLGWLGELTGKYYICPIFDSAKEDEILTELYKERKKRHLDQGDSSSKKSGKIVLRDGRTGESFDSPVVVGNMYVLKLHHIAEDKIHARSTGPYSLITNQPLGGRAQFGGQRFGEMEVWALEAYGASNVLQEMLTIKSDDVEGRLRAYEAIYKGESIPMSKTPESFKVLIKELQSLALDVRIYDDEGVEINIDKF
jgi:DNA-directed RNA polymerase subunit beta